MSIQIESLERTQLRRVPEFRSGDRLRVHFQVIEGSRRRVQVFEGVVIKRQGHGVREVFTVRKQSFGVGVERTFPLHSPKIEKIEVAARGDVRRAKLYYLRDRVGKRARIRERSYVGPEEEIEAGLLNEEVEGTEGAAAEQLAETEGAVAEETTTEESGVAEENEIAIEEAEVDTPTESAEQSADVTESSADGDASGDTSSEKSDEQAAAADAVQTAEDSNPEESGSSPEATGADTTDDQGSDPSASSSS